MANTSVLFTELLVIGSTAWLWLMPVILVVSRSDLSSVLQWLSSANGIYVGLLALATYILGVFTESLSFALEKAAVGPTSSPFAWYRNRIATVSDSDWHAAQERIWSSDTASRDFAYTRLRITVSRGAAFNALVAVVVLGVIACIRAWVSPFSLVLVASIACLVLSPVSWYFAQIEYIAKVRIAGALSRKTGSD